MPLSFDHPGTPALRMSEHGVPRIIVRVGGVRVGVRVRVRVRDLVQEVANKNPRG